MTYIWGPLVIGTILFLLFCWFVFYKKQPFDLSLLGLLTLSVMLFLILIINPESIKIGQGGVELSGLKKDVVVAKAQAERAQHLSLELAAMTMWNMGRFQSAESIEMNKSISKKILEELYGEELAEKYLNNALHRGIFLIPKRELKDIPDDAIPSVNSPLYEILGK